MEWYFYLIIGWIVLSISTIVIEFVKYHDYYTKPIEN